MKERDLRTEMKDEIEAFHNPEKFIENILEIDWLYDWQYNTFVDFYNGDYKELVACVGMRSGKTLLSSIFATYELFKMLAVKKPNTYYDMPKGSDIFILTVATKQQQAKDTVFSEIENRIENCDWFKDKPHKKRANDYEFFTDECSIHIRAEHSNSSSLAGHTSKCLTGDNRIVTSSGYKKIEDISEDDMIQDIELEETNHKFDNGEADVIEIETSKGYTIESTPDHKILIYRVDKKEDKGYGEFNDYDFEFVEAKKAYELSQDEDETVFIPILLQGAELLDNDVYKMGEIEIPLNFDLGYILGYFIGDGTFGGYKNNRNSSYLIYVSDNKPKIKENLINTIEDYFGVDKKFTKSNGKWNKGDEKANMYRIGLTGIIRKIFNELIEEKQRLKHNDAEVFDIVYESNKEMIKGFLSGLFDADGHFKTKYEAGYTMKNKEFAKEIQDLLRLLGIYSKLYKDNREEKGKVYEVRVTGYAYKKLMDELETIKEGNKKIERNDLKIPYEMFVQNIKKGKVDNYEKKVGCKTQKKTVKKYIENDNPLYDDRHFKNDFFFDEIVSVEEKGKKKVYDFEVDTHKHKYVANGFSVHNCIVLDEVARFKETRGSRGIEIVYDTLNRTLTTFGDEGKMISISSPLYKDGFLMRLLRYSRDDPKMMGVHHATWEVNPNISKDDLQHEFDRDPQSAWRDYGAQPPESLESYFKEPERIVKVIDDALPTPNSEYELPKLDTISYPCYLAGDPAYKNDRFGIAMAYFDPDMETVVVPFAHAFEPRGNDIAEIDADKVVEYITGLIDQHNVVWFLTDIWNYPTALKRIREEGVMVEQNTVGTEEYGALKEKIYMAEKNEQKILPPNETLIKELKELELHNGVRIDHPKRGSKDIADAVANAVYYAEENKDNSVEPMAFVI